MSDTPRKVERIVLLECATCGVSFHRKPSQVAKYEHHYCSNACRLASGLIHKPQDIRLRFWRMVDMSGECWIWTGARNQSGYGAFNVGNGKARQTHKLAYEWKYGPVPQGLVVDHLCRNRACVRPEHLEAVTNKVNAWDRGVGQKQTAYQSDTCRYGHIGHMVPNGEGHRRCLVCHDEQMAELRRGGK